MELRNTDMVEAAGRIIIRSGTDALSIEELSHEMGGDYHPLSSFFKNNADIVVMVLESLEKEIKQLLSDSLHLEGASDKELQNLFESLNNLFGLKPYYLSIVFSKELAEKNPAIQEIMLRIKSAAKIHLMHIINHGNNQKEHKTIQTTASLANKILGSFRLFMNEQRVINRMVRDIEILKNTQD